MNQIESKISRRQLLKSGALVAGSMTVTWPLSLAQLPDILFVSIDDLRDLPEPFGALQAQVAPNILSLCKQARIFHLTQSDSALTRSSIMTGLHPEDCHGNLGNTELRRQVAHEKGLPRIITLPQFLRDHGGYHVGGGGKLFASGFGAGVANTHYDEKNWDHWFQTDFSRSPHAVDESLTDWAISEFQTARKPRFVAVGLFRPHHKLFIEKRYFTHTQAGFDAEYLASTAYADACLGRLLDATRRRETIVVVWTHTKHRSQAPLLISSPRLKPGLSDIVAGPMDVFPTLVSLTGLQASRDLRGQWSGQSLVSTLRV